MGCLTDDDVLMITRPQCRDAHVRQAQPRQADRRHQVQVERGLPVVVGQRVEQPGFGPPALLNTMSTPPKRVDGRLDHALQIDQAGHVGGQADALARQPGGAPDLARTSAAALMARRRAKT